MKDYKVFKRHNSNLEVDNKDISKKEDIIKELKLKLLNELYIKYDEFKFEYLTFDTTDNNSLYKDYEYFIELKSRNKSSIAVSCIVRIK